jgi:hypothetical protein
MRLLLTLWLALAGIAPAAAQVSFGFSSGPVSIGINVPVYPSLVPVPGYPVYYAPGLPTNYFFYDGLYWVFDNGNWYQSSWYNGPWYPVAPDAVPLYVLRVPVRYYRHPPGFFHGWRADAPPRWDEHWGRGWAEHHRDWNHWDRGHAPARAPLPSYQRRYAGANYPHNEQQAREQHAREYRYQPRDHVVQQHYEQHGNPQRYEQRGNGPGHEQRGNAPNYEQRGNAPNYEQRGNAQNHEQRGNGQGHEQRSHEGRGSGPRDEHGERSGG